MPNTETNPKCAIAEKLIGRGGTGWNGRYFKTYGLGPPFTPVSEEEKAAILSLEGETNFLTILPGRVTYGGSVVLCIDQSSEIADSVRERMLIDPDLRLSLESMWREQNPRFRNSAGETVGPNDEVAGPAPLPEHKFTLPEKLRGWQLAFLNTYAKSPSHTPVSQIELIQLCSVNLSEAQDVQQAREEAALKGYATFEGSTLVPIAADGLDALRNRMLEDKAFAEECVRVWRATLDYEAATREMNAEPETWEEHEARGKKLAAEKKAALLNPHDYGRIYFEEFFRILKMARPNTQAPSWEDIPENDKQAIRAGCKAVIEAHKDETFLVEHGKPRPKFLDVAANSILAAGSTKRFIDGPAQVEKPPVIQTHFVNPGGPS